jgi:arsenate reductase
MILTPIAGETPELQTALRDAGLPTDDLTESGRQFFAAFESGQTLAYAGYARYGEDALLRSLAVRPDLRGTGKGRAVTDLLLEHARQAGVRRLYLLTTNAAPFFKRLGFKPVDRASAPATGGQPLSVNRRADDAANLRGMP